ncbi:uncharacterized protein LOC135826193 [Sycon ciliatum]|uniref:uncharacterized protein LOC135826193 n=1 Tax=Sycon ciliatum TaxID=27933 RepID=UPI0031F6A013
MAHVSTTTMSSLADNVALTDPTTSDQFDAEDLIEPGILTDSELTPSQGTNDILSSPEEYATYNNQSYFTAATDELRNDNSTSSAPSEEESSESQHAVVRFLVSHKLPLIIGGSSVGAALLLIVGLVLVIRRRRRKKKLDFLNKSFSTPATDAEAENRLGRDHQTAANNAKGSMMSIYESGIELQSAEGTVVDFPVVPDENPYMCLRFETTSFSCKDPLAVPSEDDYNHLAGLGLVIARPGLKDVKDTQCSMSSEC